MTIQPSGTVRFRIDKLRRHSEILRQIHSNKAFKCERRQRWVNLSTLIATAAVTFFGFLGIDKIHRQIQGVWTASELAVELLFNTLVLVVLIAAIVNLIYRLPERAAEHHRAIQILTDFIRDAEDKIELDAAGLVPLTVADLEKVRERYKGMVASLPPSTDKEFLQSKKDYAEKKRKSASLGNKAEGGGAATIQLNSAPTLLEHRLRSILMSDPERVALMIATRTAGADLWITGGFVRNAIWDELHSYRISTPLDDVDVIYFDSKKDVAHRDATLLALQSAVPNIEWSVKNQAEMKDPWWPAAPGSLTEALQRFTDTATSLAVRLVDGSNLEIIAPYGLEDLFGLVVRPTPGFDKAAYEARMRKKDWGRIWPKLTFRSDGQ